MNQVQRQFALLTVVILLIGFAPMATAFSVGTYFRSIARQSETWRCSCGAIQMITRPRADMISTTAFIVGGLWMTLMMLRVTATVAKQDREISTLRRRRVSVTSHQDIPVEEVNVVDSVAMTIGFLRPGIIISSSTRQSLTTTEYQAVLAHEVHHARRFDPFLTLLIGTTGQMFLWMPAVRRLVEQWTMLREVTADQAATNGYQHRDGLAGALLKMSTPSVSAAVGFSPNVMRIDALLHPDRPVFSFAWKQYALVTSIALMLLGVGIKSGTAWAAAPTKNVMKQCQEIHQMCQVLQTKSLMLFSPRAFQAYELP